MVRRECVCVTLSKIECPRGLLKLVCFELGLPPAARDRGRRPPAGPQPLPGDEDDDEPVLFHAPLQGPQSHSPRETNAY